MLLSSTNATENGTSFRNTIYSLCCVRSLAILESTMSEEILSLRLKQVWARIRSKRSEAYLPTTLPGPN